MRALILLAALLAVPAFAQAPIVAECSKGCTFAADPPDDPRAVACVLKGLPGGDVQTPIIDSASITPPAPAGSALKAKTCWWPGVVIAPGSYTATALIKDAAGGVSAPSNPLPFTVSPPPLGAPSAPRLIR